MNGVHFLRPAWLLALLPALLLLILAWRHQARSSDWRGIVAPTLLPVLLLQAGRPLSRLPLVLLGIGWLLAITALAGPTWERQSLPLYRAPVDRLLILDMSPSMGTPDLKPDRLTRARFAIRKLMDTAPEGRFALLVFGAEPHVVVPLTDDVATIQALLPALSLDIIPAPGNLAGPALREAGKLLQQAGSRQGQILLLSDGISDTADTLGAIRTLRQQGFRTSVIGVGTAQGAPLATARGGFRSGPDGAPVVQRLDERGLRELANSGGGQYRRLASGPLTDLLQPGDARDLSRAARQRGDLERWVERGPWLLLPLLLIAAGGFRRGWLGALALCMTLPPPVHAFSWQDLWQRPDQQASRLLEQGDARAAAERFQDPRWRATALYQAGDYAAAARAFSGQDPDSLFNRGNALARAGQLPQALAAYDQALQQQPDHQDARFNRDLVAKLLEQRQAQHNQPGAAQQQPPAGQSDQPRNAPPQQQSGRAAGGKPDNATAPPGATDNPGGDAETESTPQPNPSNSRQQAENEPDGAEQRPSSGSHTAPADTPEQARADVSPSGQPADRGQSGTVAEINSRDPTASMPSQPMSEGQIALEQWLRQIPDDPAGLLRRKFMLEHILRENGERTP
ncbi:vWA domain-containing protein [Sedimenticola thiotaurini]|uniref:VWFA domain-containing protein n=1 Tax=Sedimenticola thiotaurini TaxID=1543721 RepID=A0A0F7K0N6_9GAMM|nr:VWA domain-containing protein [Sedimenticola thiotaurini]AKH21462.1 hypothetical protein AAY24_15130 [Sedimenticola thiotaurini]